MLPPVRRTKRRDWGRIAARVLCVVFALAGLIPVGVGLLVRTSWARGLATEETRKVIKGYGVDARYDLELKLWPLSLTLRNIRVEATDGLATPFLTAKRATARPKIFGLLAGKLVIDQIEIEQPNARVVMKAGQLLNLALKLPEQTEKKGPLKPLFSVVSASEAEVDVDIDGVHVVGHEIDADVTTDDDGAGGSAFEIALRVAEARARRVRLVEAPKDSKLPPEYAVDEDVLCRLDARARIEPKRILVRRLSTYGGFDLDPAENTGLGCDVAKNDKRYVEVSLGHFAVGLPKNPADLPTLDGHVRVRAPLLAVKRLPMTTPLVDGWLSVDVELRYTAETPIPDMVGRIEGEDIRVARFSFAQKLEADFNVRRSIITSPHARVEIAEGVAEVTDIEVKPLQKGIPLRVGKAEVTNAVFTTLLKQFHVSDHPHVTWDINDVKVTNFHGQIEPLGIIGDLTSHTQNFAVYDAPVESPNKTRATGVREAVLVGKIAATPGSLQFQHVQVRTTHSVVDDVTVAIGYHELLRVDVAHAKIDLVDLSPLGNVKMLGVAELGKVSVSGTFGDPRVEGEVINIQNFSIGDLPFGNVTGGHVDAEIPKLLVNLREIHAQKGKSNYELSTGVLDFAGAGMRMDAQIASKNFDLRDLFNVFKLDEDPRFTEIGGVLDTNARMHLSLGGPEDVCKGGYLDIQASVNAHQLNLLGEKFDEGHADLEYRWVDQKAGLDGAEIDVRSLSLMKVKKEGRAPLGSVLGSVVVHRGGQLRGSMVVQGFPLARTDLLGPVAPKLEGSISGVAQIGGTLSAYTLDADLNVTPVRILGASFGSSDIHLGMTQLPSKAKIVGKTPCGLPIYAAFDKEAWLHDTSVQGTYAIDGALFGGQVKLDKVVVSRQKAAVASGHIELARFDLGPIGKLLTTDASGESDLNGGPAPPALGGELTGDVFIDRIAADDLAHAKGRFTPKAIRVSRAGQTLSLRTSPSSAPGVAVGPPIVISLADDAVQIPPMTFDLAAPNGFKGAFAVKGAVSKVTRGGDLALEAELSPIDLGILVGIVPRMTRAIGTLSGSVKLRGRATQPEFDGQLKVRGGEFGFKGLPGGITDVEVDIIADENEARVTRASGHFLGGDVSMTARMPLKGGQVGVAEATVTGRQLYVSPLEGVKATVDADLQLSLNPTATSAAGRLPLIGGEVTITSFEYTRPITIDLTGGLRGSKRTVVENYDPTLDSVALGFDVRSRVPLRIRNNLVDAQLAIDPRGLRVSGTNQRIGLRGEMTSLAGGHVRVFANDFEVQKGTIRFDDPTRIAPHVDITALTEYRRYNNTLATAGGSGTTGGAGATGGGVTSGGQGGSLWRITLHAYGDADDLKIDMTSDPALSREDIFFLLTIGLTRAEVDQVRAGSVYASAAFEAIGTVSGVDRAVKQAIPVIDDFRPGTAYSPRSGRVEPNITVGRRLGENVRARLTSGLAEDPQLRSTIEWRLGRSFTVEPSYDRINTVSSSTIGNFGLDFRWRLEFD